MHRFRPSLGNAWFVTLLFTGLAVAWTWPLAPRMTSEIAWDLGDPVLNCWIMMWTGGQVLRFLSGDWSALGEFWHGNMFYPERLTIAYSEHLTPQMLQILPLWAATGNIVLCYNLLIFAALVFSALGMYLLVRELTGEPVAAVVAGAAFMLSPYRIDQFAHMQVITTQWMPLTLYGFRRYFVHGRVRALAGATAALVLQVLSCFYYLFFFAPFAAAYVVYEMVSRRLWGNARVWRHLLIAAVLALVAIGPFLLPYLEVRDVAGMGVRTEDEVRSFSADTWSIFTTSENLTLLGQSLAPRIRPEASAFPGFTILALGLIGAGLVIARAIRHARVTAPSAPVPAWRRVAGWAMAMAGFGLLATWGWVLTTGGGVTRVLGAKVSARDVEALQDRTWIFIALALVFPAVRRFFKGVPGSAGGFFAGAWIAALLLALGPVITVGGKPIGSGPYLYLYEWVPGFNGMRVPGRFTMIAVFALSALVGIAWAALAARWRRAAMALAVVVIAAMAVESASWPFITSKRLWVEHFELEPRELASASTIGPIYDAVKAAPAGTVLVEFPYGAAPFDTRTIFFAGFHRKPVLNGFSGFFPPSFTARIPTIGWDPSEHGDAAIKMLRDSGVTHVIVHEAAYSDGKGPKITAWLRAAGLTELVAHGTDRLFAMR